MIQKIKNWLRLRRDRKVAVKLAQEYVGDVHTRQQVEKAYVLGYNDGKRDGLAIAREQATKSLKEILWQQNQRKT